MAYGFSAYESRRRQGRDLWDFMHDAVNAWIDETAPPSFGAVRKINRRKLADFETADARTLCPE